jgi:hypothetical protein
MIAQDGTPLKYEDIEIDVSANAGRLSDGRALGLVVERGAHLIVVAVMPPRATELERNCPPQTHCRS